MPKKSAPDSPATSSARCSRESAGAAMSRSTNRSLSRRDEICASATAALATIPGGSRAEAGGLELRVSGFWFGV
jgi:hypothetical protein